MKKIDAFIPFSEPERMVRSVKELKECGAIDNVYLLTPPEQTGKTIKGCKRLFVDNLYSSATIKTIAKRSKADYTLIYLSTNQFKVGYLALERMMQVAEDAKAGMVYSDYYSVEDDMIVKHPVIDYQEGSLRDDFDFGSLILFNTRTMRRAARKMKADEYEYAGLYDLRLRVSQRRNLVHINEYLYTEMSNDEAEAGERIFDYVDPRNRRAQFEMEQACTQHLKEVGAYLAPEFEPIVFGSQYFDYEASVIIPVRNRVRTIKDAISSVLRQKTNFRFNLMVVDNHSTDGTTEAIDDFREDNRLVHIIPDRYDLGIGGCWNMAVHHPDCGRFAVQLDSDDLYSGEDTLQKIVDAFYEQNCAMVVGTYQITDFDLKVIPPGVIDHREWTPENGRNNALRINGLGAPRAFYTPILREINLPNTSYGEDYALGLRISRNHQIGRIYDVLYTCRRWEDNSDASLDLEKSNRYNLYKDRIRTWELQARKRMK
ncbi:MAG: glycosyltransferase family 2 protein [Fermentimonas sp.]|jgi:hypothetical protein